MAQDPGQMAQGSGKIAETGFVVLVEVADHSPRREAYVVAAATESEAQDIVQQLYVDEPTASYTAVPLDIGWLKLGPGQMLPWQ